MAEPLENQEKEKDPNRFWWLSLLLIGGCTAALWLFQRSVFPDTFGGEEPDGPVEEGDDEASPFSDDPDFDD